MISTLRFILPLLLLAVLPCGCGHSSGTDEKKASAETTVAEEKEGVTFKEGKGLHVPDETAKYIGLRVEDVTEKKVASTLRFEAQVYRPAVKDGGNLALASAQVSRLDAGILRKSEIQVTDPSGETLRGRVTEVRDTTGTNSSKVEVLLAIEDSARHLKLGAFISGAAATGSEREVVAIPKKALLRTAEGAFVYTVSGERFVRAAVKLGAINQEFAEVTDGLYAGDQIVVEPAMTLWMAELQSIRGGQACADGH